MTVRIAMWSGPRNISTAMMRSFEARGDAAVDDEPFYAAWLAATGRAHPGRAEILAAQPTDPDEVARRLVGPAPGGKPVWYQKQMAQHLLPGTPRAWMEEVTHAFLIREPEAMLTSFIENVPDVTLEETGLPQQVELVRGIETRGDTPPILDAKDVLLDPARALAALCDRLGITYTDRMLEWPSGPRASDGVWAKHWYAAVERSTGFRPYREKEARVPPALRPLLEECRALHAELYDRRLLR